MRGLYIYIYIKFEINFKKKLLLFLNFNVLFEDVVNLEFLKWKCLFENKIFCNEFLFLKKRMLFFLYNNKLIFLLGSC